MPCPVAVRVGALVVLLTRSVAAQPAELKPIIGRWDMTVVSADRSAPSWLEVTLSGNRTLVGRFVAEVKPDAIFMAAARVGHYYYYTTPGLWNIRQASYL